MEVPIQCAYRPCHAEVDGENLENPRNDAAVLSPDPPEKEAPNSAGLPWNDRLDVRHEVDPRLERFAYH